MGGSHYAKHKTCPMCGDLINDTARYCRWCAKWIYPTTQRQIERLLELARERKAQAYVDGVARSVVPKIARVG